jgi:hypothetical protein
MASEKQVAANLANAKPSTGPKTKEGKSRSRINAWKHGLTAQTVTIAAEDPQKFEALRKQLWEEFQPTPGMESLLLDRLAVRAWRLRRIPVFEAELLTFNRKSAAEYGREWGIGWEVKAEHEMLLRLSRYEATQMNAFQRDLQQLLFLQERRRTKEGYDQEVEVIPLQIANRDAA